MKIIKVRDFDYEDTNIYINVAQIVTIEALMDGEEVGAQIELTNGRKIYTVEKQKEIYDMIKKTENLF